MTFSNSQSVGSPTVTVLAQPGAFTDRWTSVRKAQLHSREIHFPGAIPFILLPGLAMSATYFLPLARLLGKAHPVSVVELPGFGRSSGPSGIPTMPEHADWLYEWMQVLAIGECHLVSHSMVCQVAAHLAASYPARIRSLTLIGPTVDAAARWRSSQMLRLARDLTKERLQVSVRALLDVLRAGVVRTWRTGTAMLADPLEAQLARITAPTLLLRGAQDSISPESWLQTAAKYLQNGRWQSMPTGAHCVHFSAPEQTAFTILDWIAVPEKATPLRERPNDPA